FRMSFAGLRLYDPDLDGPFYMDDFVGGSGTASLSTAPEPAPLALLATGLLGLVGVGAGAKRRAKHQSFR
ncbi:MAG TPA: hypothetical protein VFI96_06665, partial [Longimicrobiaceae bacterium]|nr:hypothetical protein [Longimicrobiaceae bacterium]